LHTFLNPAVYAAGFCVGATMPIDAALPELGARDRRPSMVSPIGVFIVSRNRLFADSLLSLLGKRDELRVIGVAPDAEQIADGAEVLLFDAAGDGAGNADALARLRGVCERRTGCSAIVLGLPCEGEELIDFIEAGALGYALQGSSPGELVEAIRAVHAGRSRCSPAVAAAVVARIAERERRRVRIDRREREPLTPREREVLLWMATGRCNKEIGGRLHISVQTVKNHVHSILAKLGARRRREALRVAYEIGVLGEWGDPEDGA
jgi:two-component system nitrate/nitrite response regulator NarL